MGFTRARQKSLRAGKYFCLGNRWRWRNWILWKSVLIIFIVLKWLRTGFRILARFIYLALKYELYVVVTRIIATVSVTRLKLVLTVVKYFTLIVDAK
jgi:hypothetical protein